MIDKMKAERRETICVQAHQRQELEKDLCEAEKKVSYTHQEQHANSAVTYMYSPDVPFFTQIRQSLMDDLLQSSHLNDHTLGFHPQT